MKLKALRVKIDDCAVDFEFDDGVNFVFYADETQRSVYKKAFELLFYDTYYADEYYELHNVEVSADIVDCEVNFELRYETAFAGALWENLLIEGKQSSVWYHEISDGLINGYLKKNGDSRMFDAGENVRFIDSPKALLDSIGKKGKETSEYLAGLLNYIKNIEPVFINKQKDCRLLLLANGEFYLEGEDEDNDEQFVLSEYFKFAVTAKTMDEADKLRFNACNYPLFVCGLFEGAGDSADIEGILGILKGYSGQTVFLCPESMREELDAQRVKKLMEEIKKETADMPF